MKLKHILLGLTILLSLCSCKNNDDSLEDNTNSTPIIEQQENILLDTATFKEIDYPALKNENIVVDVVSKVNITPANLQEEIIKQSQIKDNNYKLLYLNYNSQARITLENDYKIQLKENYYYIFKYENGIINSKEFENYDALTNYLNSLKIDNNINEDNNKTDENEKNNDFCDTNLDCD